MENKKKFKFDIELLLITVFTILFTYVSFTLMSPFTNFIYNMVDLKFFSFIQEDIATRPDSELIITFGFIIITFLLIFIVAKIKAKRNEF